MKANLKLKKSVTCRSSTGFSINQVPFDIHLHFRAAKERFDEDEEFKTRARIAVTKLQNGEEAYLNAWKRICEASRKEFDAIYGRLDVKLTERGESFYNPLLQPLVEELKSQGIVVESEGANVESPILHSS